jgi:hypothetical protein
MTDPTIRTPADRAHLTVARASESAGVHLATHPADNDSRDADKGPFRAWRLDMVAEWGILLMVALITLFSVSVNLSARSVLIALAILGTFATAFLVVAAYRAAARVAIPPRYRRISDPRERFRVVGRERDIARAETIIQRAIDTGGRDASEPELFRITHASEPRQTLTIRALISFGIALAAIAVVVAIAPIDLEFHPVFVAVPLAIARIIWGFAWPTYIRIVPGRVDILRHPFLGTGQPTAQPLDLKNARILLNLRHGRTYIHPAGAPDGEWLSGVIGGPIRRGREMGLAILAAALSTFEPPPLEERLHRRSDKP